MEGSSVLPRDVELLVAAIAADRDRGASELAARALEAFEALTAARRTAGELHELAVRLEAAQPSMAMVRNVARLCAQSVAQGPSSGVALAEVRRRLEGAQDRIAKNAVKVFAGKSTIVTLSRSAAVLATCRWLHGRNRLEAVFVLESRPRLEGRRMAGELVGAGIPTTLIADALGPSVVRDCDAVLAGADSVLRDGALVNKVGTYPLALAAKVAGKPLHVACEVLKIDARQTAVTIPPPAPRPPEELEPPPEVRTRNVYFDLTPPGLVTRYIMDEGVYEPREIAELASR